MFIQQKYYQYSPLRFLGERFIGSLTERTVSAFIEFVQEGERVLDIGAGPGWIAQELQKRKGVKATLLDVVNLNQTNLSHFLYDGLKMPFPENNFDTALLIHVLHHCDRPQEVLAEAERVANKIIIVEEVPGFRFGKIFLGLRDTVNNLGLWIFVGKMKHMTNLPFNFKKIHEWEEIFKKLNLETVYKNKFPSLVGVPSVIFIVRQKLKR